jgi:hypothetical protein
MINVVDVYCRDMFVYCEITELIVFLLKKCQISEKNYVFGQLWINYDSLNKKHNFIKTPQQNRKKNHNQFFLGKKITILVHFF